MEQISIFTVVLVRFLLVLFQIKLYKKKKNIKNSLYSIFVSKDFQILVQGKLVWYYQHMDMEYLLPVTLAYLIGSFSPSIWLCRLMKGRDIREFGSGNAGSTNAFRVLGKKAGIAVMVIDLFKGTAAVQLGVYWIGTTSLSSSLFCGVAVIVGHIWTIFHGFKGGKGVNTATGVLLGILPIETLMVVGVFFLVLVTSGYVSLSSMIASISLPLAVFVRGMVSGTQTEWHLIFFVSLIPMLIVYTHRSNISRLINRTEKKIFKKS